LAELLVELSLELDLLLVGHRLHSPTDVANLRGELAVRGLERGPELDSILGLHELCIGLRDESLDLCVELSLIQLHVDLEAEILQSLQVALGLRGEASCVRDYPD